MNKLGADNIISDIFDLIFKVILLLDLRLDFIHGMHHRGMVPPAKRAPDIGE